MGRPKVHTSRTARELLEAAEHLVQAGGIGALSVRAVAAEVGTTTRAVYSLYGSKEGLFVALGARAFELLGTAVAAMPTTNDPVADLIEAGVKVFRQFALDHPALFSIGVQHTLPPDAEHLAGEFSGAAAEALGVLLARISRIRDAGLLGTYTLQESAYAFHALCEGLAAIELRGGMPVGREERLWRVALTTLVAGFAAPQIEEPS
jgi:AcrR family transcriptional regulator